MLDSYRIGTTGAVKRIGAPHENDILCGRGGAINAHIGNQRFREWIHARKNRYNLARTKVEKANVANEVMDLVKQQNPPGRFLQRDQSSITGGTTWWVECDEIKALAKTSQALREGAPSIRAAHKDDVPEGKKRTSRKRSNSTVATSRPGNATTVTTSSSSSVKRSHQIMQEEVITMPPLKPVDLNVSPSEAIEQLKANVEAAVKEADNKPSISYTPALDSPVALPRPGGTSTFVPPIKRSRLSENLFLPPAVFSHQYTPQPHVVKPDDTPPSAPVPYPLPLNAIPDIEMEQVFPMPAVPKRETSLRRTNSLALSDIGSAASDGWGDIEFVNPFEGDDIMSLPPFSPFPERNGSNGSNKYSRYSLGEKSVTSELSDLSDAIGHEAHRTLADSEFGEAMKDVYDAVHPGLASPGSDEPIPTHLYPYTPGSFSGIGSGASSSPQLIC